jgi:RNA polymerase primary sigma factor
MENRGNVRQTNRSKTEHSIKKIVRKFEQENERKPTNDEIIREYNKTHKGSKKLDSGDDVIQIEYFRISQTGNDEETPGFDEYASSTSSRNEYLDTIDTEHNRNILERMIAKLPEKIAFIIRHTYDVGGAEHMSIESIAEKYKFSEERVRQLRKQGIKLMQELSRSLKNM